MEEFGDFVSWFTDIVETKQGKDLLESGMGLQLGKEVCIRSEGVKGGHDLTTRLGPSNTRTGLLLNL